MSHDIIVKQHGGTIDVAIEPEFSRNLGSYLRARAKVDPQRSFTSGPAPNLLQGMCREWVTTSGANFLFANSVSEFPRSQDPKQMR